MTDDHASLRAALAAATEDQIVYDLAGIADSVYEMDQLQYPLVFPAHTGGACLPAVVAGPTCDGDDAFAQEHGLVRVPADLASGDPVWVLSSGAYAISYLTQGSNGFRPLPYTWIHGAGTGRDRARQPGRPREVRGRWPTTPAYGTRTPAYGT